MKNKTALLMFACALAVTSSVTFARDTGTKEQVPKMEVFDKFNTSVAVSDHSAFEFNLVAYQHDEIEVIIAPVAVMAFGSYADHAFTSEAVTDATKTINSAKTKSLNDQGEIHERRWCLCDNTMFLKSKTGYLLKPYPSVELPRNHVPRC